MNIQNSIRMASLLLFFPTLTACLGPNPLLAECGESWVVSTAGAVGSNDGGLSIPIQNPEGDWPEARSCLSPTEVANLADPDHPQAIALRASALAACLAEAEFQGLTDTTCEESLTQPYHDGSCMVRAEYCEGSGETGMGETGGTDEETGGMDEETGSEGETGFETPSDQYRPGLLVASTDE